MSGFTLIEVVAAVVLLSVAIVPMLWVLREHHDQRISPILVSQARWLATERLEEIIADRHSPSRGYAFVIEPNYPAEQKVPDFPAFRRTVSINETAADLTSPGTGYKIVKVTVFWTDPAGVERSLPIATVLTEYES